MAGSKIPTDLTRVHAVTGCNARLSFKLLADDLVIILYYGSTNERKMGRDAFRLLTWFLVQLASNDLGVRRLMTLIDTGSFNVKGGIRHERLVEYCVRFVGARIVDPKKVFNTSELDRIVAQKRNGTWLGLDLCDYTPARPPPKQLTMN